MSFAEILSEIPHLSFAEWQESVQSALAVGDAELTAEENALPDARMENFLPPSDDRQRCLKKEEMMDIADFLHRVLEGCTDAAALAKIREEVPCLQPQIPAAVLR